MHTEVYTIFQECPTQLSYEQIEQYWRDGYLAFENALSSDEVAEAKSALEEIVNRYAFNEALSNYIAPDSSGKVWGGACFCAKEGGLFFQFERGYEPQKENAKALYASVRKFMGFENAAPIFRKICQTHERVQGVIRALIGECQMYQSMALCKPAGGSPKLWHQDNAYFSVKDLDGVIGSWIALEEATVENGCMHFLPGGHKAGPLKHRHTTDCELEPDRFDPSGAVPIPLKPGGIVFFHGNAPHYTPANQTSKPRTSLQFHYRAVANPIIDKKEYESVFMEADGTPASCAAVRKRR